MKTYLLDTINRIKRYSQELDVQTTLCNIAWKVFNDSGDKEVFIFNPDKTVLITNNGIGIKQTWDWIPANKSLIINLPDDTIIMLHPEYFNSSVLALNRDGTQEYAFLIDEKESDNFTAKTLSELSTYFLAIEEDEKRKALAIEEEKKKKKAKAEMAKEKKKQERLIEEVRQKFENYRVTLFILIWLIVILAFPLSINTTNETLQTCIVIIGGLIIFVLFLLTISDYYPKWKAKKFIKENPDHELVPTIKKIYRI